MKLTIAAFFSISSSLKMCYFVSSMPTTLYIYSTVVGTEE